MSIPLHVHTTAPLNYLARLSSCVVILGLLATSQLANIGLQLAEPSAIAAVKTSSDQPSEFESYLMGGRQGHHGVRYQRPVPGSVVASFDPPTQPGLSGHRGVDLEAAEGEFVVAAAAGTVFFAGQVAGRPVISIQHSDGIRTTYDAVNPIVKSGDHVYRGQQIGTIAPSVHITKPTGTHLDWGAKLGDEYVDPLSLLRPFPVHLVPL